MVGKPRISASFWHQAIEIWCILQAVRISVTDPDRLLNSSWHCVLDLDLKNPCIVCRSMVCNSRTFLAFLSWKKTLFYLPYFWLVVFADYLPPKKNWCFSHKAKENCPRAHREKKISPHSKKSWSLYFWHFIGVWRLMMRKLKGKPRDYIAGLSFPEYFL